MKQNLNPFKWQYSTSFVMIVTSLCILNICKAQTDRYITVPALGRFSEIGYLYNERTDRIIDSSVFRHKAPSNSVNEFHNPTTTTESTTENSFEPLRQRFDISLDTAVNILAGILKPKGAASILNPNNGNEAAPTGTGVLLVKYETAVQQLQAFQDGLKESYNTYLLHHRDATHIVTGVMWGARVAVTLKVDPSLGTDINTEGIKDQLNDELVKLERENSKAEDENLNFTISINSDITLSKQVTLKSIKDVQQFLLQFPEQLKSINGGKGVPLEFSLTPLKLLREFLKEPTRHQNVTYKVQDSILRKFTDIFSNFFQIKQRINYLQKLLSSQPNCVTPHTTHKIEEISSNFLNAKSALTDALKVTLIQVRLGNQSAAALEDISRSYIDGNHSVNSYQTKFSEFDGALQKIEFCKTIGQGDTGTGGKIEYFGLNQNLIPRIGQESLTKTVLILFTKTEWVQKDAVKFSESLNTILRQGSNASSPLTSRFIADCDFDQPFCSSLSDTAIHTYENGLLTLTDLIQTVQQEENNVKKQFKQLQNATAQLFQMFEEVNLLRNKCSAGNRCFNGGSCVDTNDGFECICLPGFEGSNCEKQTDNCVSNPCHNNSACRSSINSFSCTCPRGFTGKACDVNINECIRGTQSPCENGGHCIDEVGGVEYTCVCPLPWAGQNCQYKMEDPCRLFPCQNGASCAPSLNNADFVCSCAHGFTGILCEVDIDECSRSSSLCLNGGACRNTNGSYTCDCAAGFSGIHCGRNIDDCDSSSCLNGGTCIDEVHSFSCKCPTRFSGDRCGEIAVKVCAASEKASRSEKKVVTQSEAGLINIPDLPSPSSFLFEYIPEPEPKPANESLYVSIPKPRVWTLDNVHNGEYYVFTCRVALLCGTSRDTVSVLNGNFGNGGYVISTTELLKNSSSFVSEHNYARKLYLSNTPANELYQEGFLVLIEISQVIPGNHGSNFVYTIRAPSSGSLAYGPTKSWDKFSIVVNPILETNTTLTVQSASPKLPTCDSYGILYVFEILPSGTSRRMNRLCGNVTLPISFTSQFPILAVCFGDGNGGYAFRLSWINGLY